MDRAARETRKLLMDWSDEYAYVLGARPMTREGMNRVTLMGFKQSNGKVYAIENVLSLNGVSMQSNRLVTSLP